MADDQKKWTVKLPGEATVGPLTTQEILRKIVDGDYTGTELIALYPSGKFVSMATLDPFFSEIMDQLEGKGKSAQRTKSILSDTLRESEDTVTGAHTEAITPDDVKAHVEEYQRLIKEKESKKSVLQKIALDPEIPEPKKSTLSLPVIDWQANKIEEKKIWPVFMAMGFLMIGFFFYTYQVENTVSLQGRVQLRAARGFQSEISPDLVKSLLKSAIEKIQRDTFEDYWSAQRDLIELVEGTSDNAEVRGLLCIVYKELWPFAKQDSQDIRTITKLTQAVKAMSVTSPNATACEVVQLMTQDKLREARNLMDFTLERNMNFSLVPVFFTYKSEVLDYENDHVNAIPYYEKSIDLWSEWMRPRFLLANLFYRKENYTKSAQVLRDIISKNPNHKGAKVLFGLVEFKGFLKRDQALRTLTVAMSIESRIHPRLLSDGYATLAEIYISRGDREKALEQAELSLEAWPASRKAKELITQAGGKVAQQNSRASLELMYIADQYARSGDCLSAQAEYKTIYEANPKNAVAALKAAKCLWTLNQSYEAIDWLSKSIKSDPRLVSAYVLQADYLTQKYDFFKAAQILASASRVAVNNYEVFRGLALLELRRNNLQAAQTYGLRSTKLYDSDVQTYVILSQAAIRQARTISTTTKKDADKKEELVRSSIRYANKAIEIDSTDEDAQINYGKILALTSGFSSAQSYMNTLVQKYTTSLAYRIGLAELYKEHEKYNEALDLYQLASEIDPKNKKALIGIGECFRALGMLTQAVPPLLSAAILDPTDAEAIFLTGMIYLETSQLPLAKQNFEQVLRINPLFPRANYYLGRTEFLAGNYKKSMDYILAEKKQNPNIADAYLLAAELYSAERLFNECASEYSMAMKLRPQGADIYVRAAECYRKSGALDVAEDMLSLALERESGFADLYREQGQVYETRGDSRSAIRAYKTYLELSPNARDEAEVRARMGALIQN